MMATPELRAETSTTLRNFFREGYSDFVTDMTGRMDRTLRAVVTRENGNPVRLVDLLDVDDSGISTNGEIKLTIRPGTLNYAQERRYITEVNEWSRMMSDYIKAEATFQAMEAGQTTPDYTRTYNTLVLEGSAYSAPLPLGQYLNPIDTNGE